MQFSPTNEFEKGTFISNNQVKGKSTKMSGAVQNAVSN